MLFLVEVRPMIYVLEVLAYVPPCYITGASQQINKTPLWGICTPLVARG